MHKIRGTKKALCPSFETEESPWNKNLKKKKRNNKKLFPGGGPDVCSKR